MMNSSASSDYNKFAPPQQPSYGDNRIYSSEGSRMAMAPNEVEPGPWSTGLCDCFSDPRNCCITLWCPCITFGQIGEIIDQGSNSCGVSGTIYTILSCVPGVPCIYSCIYRSKMRKQYMLKESPCGDILVHTFCDPCALCQEYRELQNRGFDMSLGWQGNMERQNGGVAMAPIVEGGMTR